MANLTATFGGTIKRLNETAGYLFATVVEPDGCEIQFQLRADDRRANALRASFNQEFVLELHSVTETQAAIEPICSCGWPIGKEWSHGGPRCTVKNETSPRQVAIPLHTLSCKTNQISRVGRRCDCGATN